MNQITIYSARLLLSSRLSILINAFVCICSLATHLYFFPFSLFLLHSSSERSFVFTFRFQTTFRSTQYTTVFNHVELSKESVQTISLNTSFSVSSRLFSIFILIENCWVLWKIFSTSKFDHTRWFRANNQR